MSSLEYREGDQPVPGYTLVKELGRGAMGVVWLALTENGFERALKIINLQQRGGKKEYRGLRTIKQRKLLHGNLLTLIDYWLKDRDGKFIKDKDELDDSDSFFAPSNPDTDPRSSWKSAATTPKSHSKTDTDPHAATLVTGAAGATQATPAVRSAATLVSRGTVTEPASNETDGGGPTDKTVDFAAGNRQPTGRPVQLIVAMELGHKTLDDRHKQCESDRQPGVPADELLAYMEQAARGLDYLHREGIVHRDIKPGNIMLVGDVAKVCDYGLIVTTDADLRATSNAFTPLYASPEAVGDKPVTGQSDQYSLAVTYIELRTGRTPYTSETAATVYAAKETGKYDLSRVRKNAVRNVLKRALAHEPNERFGSCTNFVRELEKSEHGGSGVAWWMAGAAAIALLGIGVAAIPYLRRTGPAENPSGTEKTNGNIPVVIKTTPELQLVIDEARTLRLAGKLDEAAAALDQSKIDAGSTDQKHWLYQLERLHLEVSRLWEAQSTSSSSHWESCKQTSERLWQWRGKDAEQAQLAALRLFIEMRQDPSRLSLEQPLADELASAQAGRKDWNKVLVAAEQERLQALFDAAAQRVVGARQPLPEAWKERFTQIWPAEKAVELLAGRLRKCIQSADATAAELALADLEAIASEQNLEASPGLKAQLSQVRLEAKQAQDKARIDSLNQYLTNDEFLVNSASRKMLLDQIQSIGDMGALPLARLLRIEADFAEQDSTGQRYAVESIGELRTTIARLSTASNGASQDWLDYGRFLLARAELVRQRGGGRIAATPDQVDVLLRWPESAAATWQTPRRKAQAIDALLDLADAGLSISSERPWELPRETISQAPTAISYLEKAQRLGGESPDLAGLLSLAMSVPARQSQRADAETWSNVARNAEQAVDHWASVTDKQRQGRLPAVQYVAALAASRLQDAAARDRNRRAVVSLAKLLQPNFKDADTANPRDDRTILENVVLPGLKLPVADSDAPAPELAALWAAKGRLIERNPTSDVLAIQDVDAVSHSDDYAKAILTAHAAYSKALKLQDVVAYAAGAARTLLKLPREVFDWSKYESELAHLVEGRGEAALTDPSLLYAEAFLLRRKGFAAASATQKLQLFEQALDRFARLDAVTSAADPYAIRGVALCNASDTSLKAAFSTPIKSSDEAQSPADERTKYYYLRQALNTAGAAVADLSIPLPEEALVAKGNALEDFAHYYKETDKYPLSAAAFQEAVNQTGRGRSKAYAFMGLGRCQYRWAIDALTINANPDERAKRLREAHESLSNAMAHAESASPQVVAEAKFWLATVKSESALEGPGDLTLAGDKANRGFLNESLTALKRNLADRARKQSAGNEIAQRFRQMNHAREEIVAGAIAVRAHSQEDWAGYLPTAVALGAKLAEEIRIVEAVVPPIVQSAAIWQDVRAQAEELLSASAQRPSLLSPSKRRLVIDQLVRMHQAQDKTPDQAIRMMQDYEKLFVEDSDDARFQVVMLRLKRLNYSTTPDFREAQQLASRITDPILSNKARGYCQMFDAGSKYSPYRKRLDAYLNDPATSKELALEKDDEKLLAMQMGFAAAIESLAKAADPKTGANLQKLIQAPLGDVERGRWGDKLSPLEAAYLRLTIEETAATRKQLFDVLYARIFLHQKAWQLGNPAQPLPADGRLAFLQVVQCLKPRRFLEVHFNNVDMTEDDRVVLRLCDARVAKEAK